MLLHALRKQSIRERVASMAIQRVNDAHVSEVVEAVHVSEVVDAVHM